MAWSKAHAKLHTILRKRALLPQGGHILMAVSGGQDSLCLARLLLDLKNHWHWSLGLLHCDHQWRADSAKNAAHVLQLANDWSLPAWLEVASEPLRSEAAARQWRYKKFAEVARRQGYGYVVTGHTASDRAETVLYNLIRGTSIDGLSSLSWQRSLDTAAPSVSLVRPLLDFSRQETGDFCRQQQISVWEDSSNADLTFRRNRIRQEMLPYLRKHFNPQVERALSQLSEITAADVAYLQDQADDLYARAISETDQHSSKGIAWEIDIQIMTGAALALQRRVLRQLLQQALSQPPSFRQVQDLLALLSAPNGSRTSTFPEGLGAQVRKPVIWIGSFS